MPSLAAAALKGNVAYLCAGRRSPFAPATPTSSSPAANRGASATTTLLGSFPSPSSSDLFSVFHVIARTAIMPHFSAHAVAASAHHPRRSDQISLRQAEQRTAGKGDHSPGFAQALGDYRVIGHSADAAGHIRYPHGFRLRQSPANSPESAFTGSSRNRRRFGWARYIPVRDGASCARTEVPLIKRLQ